MRDALQTLGARLRAAGATPAAHRAPDPEDLAAAVERLRERLTGTSEPGGLTVEQVEALAARYKPDNARRARPFERVETAPAVRRLPGDYQVPGRAVQSVRVDGRGRLLGRSREDFSP
jgi:hypothetical protein